MTEHDPDTTENYPGRDAGLQTVEERDDLIAMSRGTHPSTEELSRNKVEDHVAKAAIERFEKEGVSVEVSTYECEVTVTSDTLEAWASLDDETFDIREKTAVVQRRFTNESDEISEVVLLEGPSAHYPLVEALGPGGMDKLQSAATEAKRRRRGRHASLTVGERNPGLSSF